MAPRKRQKAPWIIVFISTGGFTSKSAANTAPFFLTPRSATGAAKSAMDDSFYKHGWLYVQKRGQYKAISKPPRSARIARFYAEKGVMISRKLIAHERHETPLGYACPTPYKSRYTQKKGDPTGPPPKPHTPVMRPRTDWNSPRWTPGFSPPTATSVAAIPDSCIRA